MYLGQLPPAEVARLKAELAETLIANFCYPRFFDQRTDTLRTRPVDRAKRQEVWLYLSSFDFGVWNRVDLMSVEFQHCIERLFIQFVQRNRSFFGEQGRRRMLDIRMLIGGSAVLVAQGLRGHLAGQKQGFGSPRQVLSWGTSPADGRREPTWEQISSATMLLQQQLQELRGEVRGATRPPQPGAVPQSQTMPMGSRQQRRSQPLGEPEEPVQPPPKTPVAPSVNRNSRQASSPAMPTVPPTSPAMPRKVKEAPPAAFEQPEITQPVRRSEQSPVPQEPIRATISGAPTRRPVTTTSNGASNGIAPLSPTNGSVEVVSSAQAGALTMGDDDLAIFEEMRHQMMIWLRVEAVRSGLELAGQGPAQLLDQLRQQPRCDETRLQVISTLLNLANQVIKTGLVSVLDYKQALTFHLMHTRQ
jgi:hypothetical protein